MWFFDEGEMRPSLSIPCDGDSIYRQWQFVDEVLLLDSGVRLA